MLYTEIPVILLRIVVVIIKKIGYNLLHKSGKPKAFNVEADRKDNKSFQRAHKPAPLRVDHHAEQ